MKETSLKLAQQDIDEALETIEALEETMDKDDFSKHALKEKFLYLSNKMTELEHLLKQEGIL